MPRRIINKETDRSVRPLPCPFLQQVTEDDMNDSPRGTLCLYQASECRGEVLLLYLFYLGIFKLLVLVVHDDRHLVVVVVVVVELVLTDILELQQVALVGLDDA